MLSGTIKKFPDLKFAMSEGGVGWVPPWLDRLGAMSPTRWTGRTFLSRRRDPTDAWRKNFLACYITEPSALSNRDRLGIDTIARECDYPHSDSTWPNSPEMLRRS